ncbi:FixH family protein [Aurantiacibacter sp. D1-12]|uniref:FixH family protein n=1 Tax=Aurantiacibacter sp. D1-12 TaxID=2993658 RepID=UPI00237D210C|nr:FixH family protein [Aurantiacibacter sp. D1-12]MDE1467754.1 FixH family protein [Aurantiacibacter sp. D1-12]
MATKFTGKKMAATMVGGFGIIIAVNFTMAYFATSGFSGVVVDNSYVASQQFNDWLDAAEAQEALGWHAEVTRQGDRLLVTPSGIPDGAEVEAVVRRPLGDADVRSIGFVATGDGAFLSEQDLPDGRWIIRLSISHEGDVWRQEFRLQ